MKYQLQEWRVYGRNYLLKRSLIRYYTSDRAAKSAATQLIGNRTNHYMLVKNWETRAVYTRNHTDKYWS